jgi:hypothetical protein
MADEFLPLSKLSQLSPSGKMRDSKEIPIGKEVPQKKGKKNRAQPSRNPKGEGREDPTEPEKSACGKILDITI